MRNIFKKKPQDLYQKTIDQQVSEKFDIVFVSSYTKGDWYVLETEHTETKEKKSFMYKANGNSYGWYVLPHLEKLEYRSLYKHLSNLHRRDEEGMFDIIKQPNSLKFIMDEDDDKE